MWPRLMSPPGSAGCVGAGLAGRAASFLRKPAGSELRFAPIYNLCSWPAHTKANYIFPGRNLGRK
eukprot:COSAG04_NODE_1852_length_5394_cov_8.108215_6_plen_64_part_01